MDFEQDFVVGRWDMEKGVLEKSVWHNKCMCISRGTREQKAKVLDTRHEANGSLQSRQVPAPYPAGVITTLLSLYLRYMR